MRNKYEEAEFFLEKMRSVKNVPRECDKYYSAFLTAARSVISYAKNLFKKKASELKWIKEYEGNDKVLKFFDKPRNINAHKKPVKPERSGQAAALIHFMATDKAVEHANFIHYEHNRVEGWDGKEDLWELCGLYLERLATFIHEGAKQKLW